MDEKAIIQFLKERMKIEGKWDQDFYGNPESIDIVIKIGDEEICSTNIYTPSQCLGSHQSDW